MSTNNNLKNKIQDIYRTHGMWVDLFIKACLTLSIVLLVNFNIGGIPVLSNYLILTPVAIIVGLLPTFLTVACVTIFIVVNLYYISVGTAVIYGVIAVVLGVLCGLFSPRNLYLTAITLVTCLCGGIYAVPMILGVIVNSFGLLSVITGVSLYTLIHTAAVLQKALKKADMSDGMILYIESILNNTELLIAFVAVFIGFIVCSSLKKTQITESWKLGIITAFMINLAVVFIGVIMSVKISMLNVIMFSVIGLIVAFLLEGLLHDVEYKSMKYVEFEDGEYYYYVKAVPKRNPVKAQNELNANVGAQNKNLQRRREINHTHRANVNTSHSPNKSNRRK